MKDLEIGKTYFILEDFYFSECDNNFILKTPEKYILKEIKPAFISEFSTTFYFVNENGYKNLKIESCSNIAFGVIFDEEGKNFISDDLNSIKNFLITKLYNYMNFIESKTNEWKLRNEVINKVVAENKSIMKLILKESLKTI